MLPSGSPLHLPFSSTSELKQICLLSHALSSCLSFSSTCQFHCPLQKKSKPTEASFCNLFNGHLPLERVSLFLQPFLPGFGAISKGASVFLLWKAWYLLLAGSDNGPHMVVLQQLSKTWGLDAWAQPRIRPIKRSSSQPFVWAHSL